MLNVRLTTIVCCAALLSANKLSADDGTHTLHVQIDRLIASATPGYDQHASALSDDEEFLRRIHLDLTGRIPSAEVALKFFADTNVDKRTMAIDRLLRSPEHVRHLQHHFDVMLMQRRPKKHVDVADWHNYLFTSIRHNKTWDEFVREILSADGFEADKRASARFLLARELKREETTRDVGRIFLGRDMECAQCHDHPVIGDYAQQHYFGISAFLNRSYLFTDPKTKKKSIGEKAEGTVKFTSVFTSVEAETPPRMLELPALTDPEPDKEPYVVKPEKTTRGVPKYSRRLLLAKAVTDPANRAFQLNIANRLWALMMGRGLVEPLDMLHSDNPPTHPELLDLLADDLAKNNYDMRRTIHEIVLSNTYQRSSRFSHSEEPESERYYAGLLKPLSPEQLAWSMMQASGVVEAAQVKAAAKLLKDEPGLKPDNNDYAFKQEAIVNKALTSQVGAFVTVFASSNESSRFDATANQALFVLNGPVIDKLLKPAGQNLIARLLECKDDGRLAQEIFLTLLTRMPTESEVAALGDFINHSTADRKAAIQQAVRSILCSAEFRFNH